MSISAWEKTGITIASTISALGVIVICVIYVTNLDKDKEVKLARQQEKIEYLERDMARIESEIKEMKK
jgi:hypothetical protein